MEIIIKPIVTEKMTSLGEKLNRYGFQVRREANKIEIKKAVEELYNVTVVAVNTAIPQAKKKSRNTSAGRVTGTATTHKKAIVTLKKGEQIDFYSNI